MNHAILLLQRCRVLGLRLRRKGEGLEVRPARLAPPELLAELRIHKPSLLLLLEAESASLPHDCAPWLHTARQVVSGEFDSAHRGFLESVLIGVRNIAHPTCQQARARLENLLGRSHKESRP